MMMPINAMTAAASIVIASGSAVSSPAMVTSGDTRAARANSGTISLTPANANVMRHIDRNPGATPSDVADATGVLRSNLSTSLRELERLGFIERRSDPADGRGVQLFSTERAARNLAVIRTGWGEHTRDALGHFANVEDATALIERLTAGLVQARRAHRP